jgi:type IV fimbrial biogenesis protein FimT
MLIARHRGFTVIELMVGIALLAVLTMLAFPTFTTMLQNARLRGVGESILAGLQVARAEALRRNQTAEFLLMAEDPDPALVTAFGPNTTGPNWAVRILDSANLPLEYIEGRSGLEGAGHADPAKRFARISAANLAAGNTIRFDSLGRTNVGLVNAVFNVWPADPSVCKANGGDVRCVQVVVTPGGRVRMCDPSVDAVANPNDTRAC